MEDFPEAVRGFIPKLVGSVLRFAGILYLIYVFNRGDEPGAILNVSDIEKGIKVAEFYLGHIIEAMEALVSENAEVPFEITDQSIHLAETLKTIQGDLYNGMLPVGFIQKSFNKTCSKSLKVRSEKAMGAILRNCNLTIKKKQHWKEKHGISCLLWDEKTISFIKTSPQDPQSKENQGFNHEDIGKLKSSKPSKAGRQENKMRTLRTLKKQSPHMQDIENTEYEGIEDIEDVISKENKNSELDWSF